MEMSLETLRNELNKMQKRASSAVHLDTKPELVNNIYPLIESLIDSVEQRFDEIEDIITDFVDETGSIIQEGLAKDVLTVFELGGQLAEVLQSLQLDEVTKKRVADLIGVYSQVATATAQAVMEATVSLEDDSEDDDEDDSEEDEDDEDDTEDSEDE